MKFVHPVNPKNGNDKYPFYLKGASNRTGYYPIGRMNTWHGGIHYEGSNPIKAIADGKIIAYRVPEKYYEQISDGKKSWYSNAFVLIQHDYVSPKELKMTFYSLYNHLSSFEEMQTKTFPKIYKIDSYTVADTANDSNKKVKGVRIRMTQSGGSVLATAPKGATLTIKETNKEKTRWKVEYITPLGKVIEGYAYALKENGKFSFDHETGKVLEEPDTDVDGDFGANLYEKADKESDVKQLLTRGASIEIDERDQGKTGWLKVKKVDGKSLTGYCHTDKLKIVDILTLTNEDLDQVKNVCIEVRAGDIIGYAGLNGFEKKEEHRCAHVEVFSPDDVTPFLTNANTDGDKSKNFAKLSEGTELKKKFPLKLITNTPVKKTGKTTLGYIEVEVDNLEVIVDDRDTELPSTYASNMYTFNNESDATRLTNFNKIVGDIAKIGDKVQLNKKLEGDQRRVSYLNDNKGLRFWVKNECIEEKTLNFTVLLASTNEVAGQTTPSTPNNGTQNRAVTESVAVASPPVATSTTESKTYFRLNKDVSEIYLISPEDENANTKIVADTIVNIKEGKTFKDKDDKEWYYIEPIGLKKNGVAINYKGLISKDDLGDLFSAYDWTKFGFEVKEDATNTYIYNFDNKEPFFADVCSIVDEDEDGILEPYELQRALNNHYAAEKLSHLVCKHHNEWAYGGQYLSGLIDNLDQFYTKAIENDADGEELANQQELDAIKQERLDAFSAKVEQLALWEDIETRTSSYRSKYINGALMTSPVTMGGYLTYKAGKWIYERMAYGDKKEEAIPLSPFPIANPVVYHFHPVAFVEQMRRMSVDLIYHIYHTGIILEEGNIEGAKEVRFVYHDKNGSKHELGRYFITEIPDYEKGTTIKPVTNINSYIKKTGRYAGKVKTIWYKKKNINFKAINIKANFIGNYFQYKKGDFLLKFTSYTNREYAKPICFAALLGAILDSGYEDVKVNGFTSIDGTSFPSVSHPGGINVDISNLDNKDSKTADGNILIGGDNYSLKRTSKLAEGLYKFGYMGIRSSDKDISHCTYISGHKDHLHCENFKPQK
ncbi:hypothetical protein QUH73_10125 [Labilibaculum sp. K2S]|uniref:hypothetical protein n=1 Tax=Labilibaculum sp. K2S TaxID=3056386 RepID=UPI0025A40D92|nr:hypothetical protein [Labilibaculum sp. K2S]MDM8160169.1 hypothetical protein [Labilibaculum sp. K2S]